MSANDSKAVSRRTVFAVGGAAGALAAAAAAVPLTRRVEPVATVATAPQPDATAGYQATPHVLRYYQTARV